jgi:membrane peptidoglycan carboxypeptidase
MQLVKNVFLTRNKTISRKLEEAMIVWMIESNRLVSKERMLEVYFNIIEWGPGIYGITEASQYYFKKKPSELNLEESIYLAMIVPRPKGFKYYFDAEGKIKEPYFGYFRLISGMLEKKGIIQEGEKIESPATLELKGQAKELVIKPDTLATDSLPLLEELFE